jgi:hypothetical protein
MFCFPAKKSEEDIEYDNIISKIKNVDSINYDIKYTNNIVKLNKDGYTIIIYSSDTDNKVSKHYRIFNKKSILIL